MRSLKRPALVLLLVAAITLPATADKAKTLYDQGQDAEARQNYEGAYDFYKQAYDLKPKDLRYRTSLARRVLKRPPRWFTAGRSCAKKASWTKPWPHSKKPFPLIPLYLSPSRNWRARRR
jgi:tetratricopeptide (TPR) repeat protein